jgi:glycosyltransferase involved in cell wall biosynthesis
MPLDPQDVFTRYAELFRTASRTEIRPTGFVPEKERILFVANGMLPTLQVSFEQPLAPLVNRGEFTTALLTEEHVRRGLTALERNMAESAWVDRTLAAYDPSVIIFCRYGGPASGSILDWARREKVPVIYHIDDDLLTIPSDIGERKFAMHNASERLAAVRRLLTGADLVYASTPKLRERLLGLFPELPVIAGKIYCAGSVAKGPKTQPNRKIGYMASADHAHNLDMILPAIVRILERNPDVSFELFGSIPMPSALHRFGDRIRTAPPVANYSRFITEFAEREWDVGVCPLAPIEFNMMKANTKWVEYTSVGAAVVASRGTVYDECCADGCGLLAGPIDEWVEAVEYLINDDEARLTMAERAQAKLRRDYSIGRLRNQVLDVIGKAREAAADRESNHSSGDFLSCQTA